MPHYQTLPGRRCNTCLCFQNLIESLLKYFLHPGPAIKPCEYMSLLIYKQRTLKKGRKVCAKGCRIENQKEPIHGAPPGLSKYPLFVAGIDRKLRTPEQACSVVIFSTYRVSSSSRTYASTKEFLLTDHFLADLTEFC